MSNEPVIIGNIVTMIFAVFGTLLAKWGINEDDAKQVIGLVGAVVSAAIAVLSWFKQRQKVTPVANPMNNEGQPLVPNIPG